MVLIELSYESHGKIVKGVGGTRPDGGTHGNEVMFNKPFSKTFSSEELSHTDGVLGLNQLSGFVSEVDDLF